MRKRIAVGTIAGLAAVVLIVSVVLFTYMPFEDRLSTMQFKAVELGSLKENQEQAVWEFAIQPPKDIVLETLQICAYDYKGNKISGERTEFQVNAKTYVALSASGAIWSKDVKNPIAIIVSLYFTRKNEDREMTEKVPIRLYYQTTSGRNVNKNYILDTTQKPIKIY